MKVNHNEQYEKRIIFNLRHAYFAGNEAPVSLSATGSTDTLLRKNNAVFRRDAPGSWSVCVPSGQHFGGDDVLRFEIRPRAKEFYYCSLLSGGEFDGWSIVNGDTPGVWKVIEIPITDFISGRVAGKIDIEIKTIEKYIEFFLIPKYNPPGIRLRLTENKGAVMFNEPETVQLWNDDHVQRIISTKPLTMSHPRPLKMRLWEIRNSGDRLLSDAVPLPACDSPSPISPENTITTYFYY